MALIERLTSRGNLYPDGQSTFATLVAALRRMAENRDTVDAQMESAWKTADTATLNTAKSYAEGQAATAQSGAITAANTYASQQATEAQAAAITTANTYTDTEVGAAEARAVASAGDYTDEQVGLVQAGVVTDAGIDSGIDRALTDGRIDTSVNDTALAGAVNDPASASRGALDAHYDDQYSTTAVLYVDPVNGMDTRTGASWKKSKKTIQAAVDAAPKGATILLAPGNHNVGTGVVCADNQKALTIQGATPVPGRRHAAYSANGGVHIRSGLTGDARPMSLFLIGTSSSSIANGWTFRNFYVDADSIAPGGCAFETSSVSSAVLDDVSSRCLDTTGTLRYLIRSGAPAGGDASWWTLSRVNTTGLGLAHSRQGNYWTFQAVNVHGNSNRPAGPALDIDGSQHNFNGLNFETWVTAIKATGCRGLQGMGIMGENVSTMLHMVECRDAVITINSAAAVGVCEVLDENGVDNIVIGTDHRKIGTTRGAISISDRGMSPLQLASGTATVIHGRHPNLVDPGEMMLPTGITDLVGCGVITAEYWSGTAWLPWDTETAYLSVANLQAVTVDAEHKRCRFRTTSLVASGAGLAYVRASQSFGTPSTYTFRLLNSARDTVLAEHAVTADSPAQTRGAIASFAHRNAQYFELECDFGLTGTQTAAVRRLHLWATEPHTFLQGKTSRGAKGPLNVIEGAPGDIYHCVGTTASDTNIGIWVYGPTGGSNTTGWRKLAYAA